MAAGFTSFPVSTFGDVIDAWTTTNNPVELGQVIFYKSSGGYWSVVKYCAAGTNAGWSGGDVLVHDAAQNDPANLAIAATADGGMPTFRGIAAATVASAARGWVYVGGYCPKVAMPTLFVSGQPLRVSATYTGRLSSAVINSSLACVATALLHPVAISLETTTFSTANSFGSCNIVHVWL